MQALDSGAEGSTLLALLSSLSTPSVDNYVVVTEAVQQECAFAFDLENQPWSGLNSDCAGSVTIDYLS